MAKKEEKALDALREKIFSPEERKLLREIRHKPPEVQAGMLSDLQEKVSLRKRLKMAVQPRHIQDRGDVIPVLDGKPLDQVTPEQREAFEIQEWIVMNVDEKTDLTGTTVMDLKYLKDQDKEASKKLEMLFLP